MPISVLELFNGIKLNETDESEDEWEILKDNYSKLKYIHDLINFYHYLHNNYLYFNLFF